MEITGQTKVLDLLKEYPFLEDFLKRYNEKFSLLSNPVVRSTMGKIATLKMASELAGIDLERFILDIKKEIEAHKGMQGDIKSEDKKQDILKEIIKDLHRGVPFDDVKKRFNELIKDLDPSEIARMEEDLIREGMPVQEVQRLCDLHVNIFKDLLNQRPVIEVPEGHPISTYQEENRILKELLNQIQSALSEFKGSDPSSQESLYNLLKKLEDINYHYLRKENQLFPYLERHDFTGPSQVMWAIHDEIRKEIKEAQSVVKEGNVERARSIIPGLIIKLAEMIYKEENILFPTAIKLLSKEEWEEIKKGEGEIGFAFITPKEYKKETEDRTGKKGDMLSLSTGILTLEQIDAILKTLPVDISFVDEKDEVKYYSDTKERIFPRSPAVIGRQVRMCHPPKSVHIVERILDAFKRGEKDVAEFYIKHRGRDIHIRYFAVRGPDGRYLGTLEVSQDVTDIKKLSEEKRLLDWN